jgi:cytochrome c553
MNRAPALAPLLLVAALLSACGGGGGKEQRAGAAVFEKAGCGNCHVLEAARSKGKQGPNLDDLKPEFLRVAAQVKNGGNGMPSFKGKLTPEEIQQVSQFVAESTGKGSGKIAEFKPDDKTVASCAQSGDFACYEQAFGNEMFRDGPKKALAHLEQAQSQIEPVAANCHRIAHTMGSAALARYKGKVADAMLGGNAFCASGYYHGIIEQAFYGVRRNQIQAKAQSMCADPKLRTQVFLTYQCVHGLGHGLMLYTAYELPASLKICDGLSSDFDRTSCTGGVFMENFATSRGATSDYVKKSDLIYPCDTVAEKHKYYCYLLVTANILPAVGYDFKKAAPICLKSERDWIDECYQSYGRDVSGNSRTDVKKALKLCSYAGRYEGACVYGVSKDIVNTDAKGDRAAEFCPRAPKRWQPRCFEGVGSVLASLNGTAKQRRDACRAVTRKYYDDCLAGAGVI